MELQLYKTLWGHQGEFELACRQAKAAGFTGIEGPAPAKASEQEKWQALLAQYGLSYIAEITTAGSYVPDRQATLDQHLQSLDEKIRASLPLTPRFINCLGGCDAWPEAQSLEFFKQAIAMAQSNSIDISFETHRGRSLFNPWITQRLCEALPQLKLTCDFSHWCVVCERLIDTETDALAVIMQHAHHVHARVGYDQGPQVSDPRSSLYQYALKQHQQWWQAIWQQQLYKQYSVTTMTPEFGPDGYQMIDPQTHNDVVDLWEINCWMAKQQQQSFASFTAMMTTQ